MKKPVRRVLFYIFFSAFCVLAPVIVLYTAGYRFSVKSGIDLDVGSLSITTVPTRASIIFNNLASSKRSPYVFKELSPGRYDIALNRDGFIPWQGLVQVLPGLTTYIQHIVLFKSSPLEQLPLELGPDDTAVFSNKTIAYTTTIGNAEHVVRTLSLYSVRSENIKEIDTLPGTLAYTLTWSKDGSYLLAQTKDDIRIYTASGTKIDPMITNDIIFTRAFWDTQDDDTVYIEAMYPDRNDSALIYEINLHKSPSHPVTHPIETIGVVNDSTYLIKQSFATSILTLLQNGNEQELVRLPRSTYTLVDVQDPNLVLKDAQGDFYLVNPSNSDIVEIPAHSTNYAWDKQGERFAYTNETELHIVSPQQRQSDLLLRLTNGASRIAWHPSGQRLLFSTSTTIEAIDGYQYTFVRDRTILVTMESIDDFWVDARGKYIYVAGTQAGIKSIYSLRIK